MRILAYIVVGLGVISLFVIQCAMSALSAILDGGRKRNVKQK